MRLLSVDPGSVHVGVAIWEYDESVGRWFCDVAREVDPVRYADKVVGGLIDQGKIDRIAIEAFHLGGGQEALYQKGSSFGMVELIGLTRHHARWIGVTFEEVTRSQRKGALTRMKAIGWRFPVGSPTHVKDAIAVGAVVLEWRAANHVEGDGVRRT